MLSIYYKTLGTAFAAILKHLFYLKTGGFCCCFFLGKYLRFMVWKIGPDGVKSHKGNRASGKTLNWPISSQNVIHTDIELG